GEEALRCAGEGETRPRGIDRDRTDAVVAGHFNAERRHPVRRFGEGFSAVVAHEEAADAAAVDGVGVHGIDREQVAAERERTLPGRTAIARAPGGTDIGAIAGLIQRLRITRRHLALARWRCDLAG